MGSEPHLVKAAALVWAHATAVRDRRPRPQTGGEKIRGIQRRLGLDGARLLLAWREGQCVAFTLFAPQAQSLEIFYLAVAPQAWGQGIAGHLLAAAEDHARSIGRSALELWVIDDNHRALEVYTRSGFVDTAQTKMDESSGRFERQLRKHII